MPKEPSPCSTITCLSGLATFAAPLVPPPEGQQPTMQQQQQVQPKDDDKKE
jgi:hypothetical protein